MARDPLKLDVFRLADELAIAVYRETRALPNEERFGLQSQLRRAAVSVPTNLVEGCLRPSERDFVHFVSIARSSSAEVKYLLSLSVRLGYLPSQAIAPLVDKYDRLGRSLSNLITNLPQRQDQRPKTKDERRKTSP